MRPETLVKDLIDNHGLDYILGLCIKYCDKESNKTIFSDRCTLSKRQLVDFYQDLSKDLKKVIANHYADLVIR